MLITENIFIGRQPILDSNQNIIAFELLFRSGSENSVVVTDDLYATAKVLVNIMNNIGINKLLGNKLGFINIDDEVINKDILKSLQKDRFVFEILESTIMSDDLIKAIGRLKEEGCIFALDDFVFDDATINRFEPLFDKISYVKVDVKLNPHDLIRSKMKIFKHYMADLLAEKIENMEEFFFFKELGFKYFQGYFFAKPTIFKEKGLDPSKLAILEIIRLIYQDADIKKVENVFKAYPEMTFNLLKFINSAAIGNRNKIESVRQALALLGQRQLMNWLILMEYAYRKGSPSSNPLLFSAIERAKTMELTLRSIKKGVNQNILEEAYLTGLLSLMDALLQVPMTEILSKLNLSQDISDALLDHKNILGKLLLLVKKTEEDSYLDMTELLKQFEISMGDYNKATMESFCWAQDNGSKCLGDSEIGEIL